MRQALALFGLAAAGFVLLDAGLGHQKAVLVAYGAVVAMALSISGTFFWLWRAQATPLALGMGFSWAGTAGVLGWWWLFRLLDRPEAMREHAGLFVFVAAYFVGALLHFRVVGASLGRRALILLVPLGAMSTVLALRLG